MSRKLNFKRLGLSLVIVLAAGVAVHFLHGHQVRRNASMFLTQADAAAAEGDGAQALQHLDHYLACEPGDTAALVKYVELMQSDKLPRSPRRTVRVLEVMEQVLRREPGRQEIRRKLVRQAVEA